MRNPRIGCGKIGKCKKKLDQQFRSYPPPPSPPPTYLRQIVYPKHTANDRNLKKKTGLTINTVPRLIIIIPSVRYFEVYAYVRQTVMKPLSSYLPSSSYLGVPHQDRRSSLGPNRYHHLFRHVRAGHAARRSLFLRSAARPLSTAGPDHPR